MTLFNFRLIHVFCISLIVLAGSSSLSFAEEPKNPRELKPQEIKFVLTVSDLQKEFATLLQVSHPGKNIPLADDLSQFILQSYHTLSAEKPFRGIPTHFIRMLMTLAVGAQNTSQNLSQKLIHALLMNWFQIRHIHYQSKVLGFNSIAEVDEAITAIRKELDKYFVDMADAKSILLDAARNSLLGFTDPSRPDLRIGLFGGPETGKTALPTAWAQLLGYRVKTISLTQFTGDSPKEFMPQFLSTIAQSLIVNPETFNSSVVFIFTNIEQAHPMVIEQIITMMRDRVMHISPDGKQTLALSLQNTGFILNTSLGTEWLDDFIAGRVTVMNTSKTMGFGRSTENEREISPLQLQQVLARALLQGIENENRKAQLRAIFDQMDAWIPCTPLDEKGFRDAMKLSITRLLSAQSSQYKVQFTLDNEDAFLDYTMSEHYVASAKPGFALAVRIVERFIGAELGRVAQEAEQWKEGQVVAIHFEPRIFEASMSPLACGDLLRKREQAQKKTPR